MAKKGKKSDRNRYKTGRDILREAGKHEDVEIEMSGRHPKIRYKGRSLPVPMHGELKEGTRRRILKTLRAWGIIAVILIVLYVISAWFPAL